MVTVTLIVPDPPAGEVAEIEVVELTTTPVPAFTPKATVESAVNPVPVTVTEVPPAVGPLVGLTALTVGAP